MIVKVRSMTLDDWYWLFQVVSVGLLFLTFAVGAFVVLTGKRINKRDAERMLSLEAQLADARTKQAEAELRLEKVKKRQDPRKLNIDVFTSELKKRQPREVEILFQPGDNEAHWLATQIQIGILSAWKPANPFKSLPRPIPSNATRSDLKGLPAFLFNSIPHVLRLTTSPFGISVISNKSPSDPDAPQRAFADAIVASGLDVSMNVISDMPEGLLLVVVAPKP